MNRREMFVALGLFLAPFVLYFPVTLGQQIFFDGDISLFYYPLRVALARALAEGRLPLWSSGMMMGFPLIAEGQIGAFYPLNQILYRVLPAWRALGLEMLFHLGWMMVGTFCFARRIKLSVPSAALAALVFAGNAYVMANLLFPSVLATMAWLPWSLWLFQKIFSSTHQRARIIGFALLCATITAQIFSAHPYHEFFNTSILLVYAGLWRWRQNDAVRWWQPLVVIIAAVLIALGLGAVQLLPTLELSQVSNRAQLTFDEFTIYSVELQHLLLLVAPFAQGGVYGVPGGVVSYFGILPLMLAIIAPFIVRKRATVFWSALALGGLALAFGENNPLYTLLYSVPIFNSFRLADRFLYVFVFAAAILSAFAFDALIARVPHRPSRLDLMTLAISLLLGIEIILAYQFSLEDWQALWNGLPIVFILLGMVILIAASRQKLGRDALVLAVISITLFDLVAFAAVFIHSKNALVSANEFLRSPSSLTAIQARSGQARVLTAGALVPPFAVAQASLFPYLGTVYGVEGVKGATSFFIQRVRDYTNSFSPGMLNLANVRYLTLPQFPPDENGDIVSQPSDKFALRLGQDKLDVPPMDATAIQIDSYIDGHLADGAQVGTFTLFFDDGSTAQMPLRVGIETAEFKEHVARARFNLPTGRALTGIQLVADARTDILHIEHIRLLDAEGKATLLDYLFGASNHSTIYRDDRVTIVENFDALPRAFLIHSAQVLSDSDTLHRLRDYTFDARQGAILSDGAPLTDDSPEQADGESVEIASYQPERVQINVTATRKGYLILSDTWYPGWTARIDGKDVPIYRAYYTLRAVPVEPGTHAIEFEYRPNSFYVGATISILTLVLGLIGIYFARR